MDCDDDDISRHNLQLAGDSRSKSSVVLRPYDFPNFDFDDSLQSHLRFDNLVETEVFLGIQSQEDNQWMEDFTPGTNGMEFNSTPGDSCSISKRTNVWSEATSSESVEMLLKSVGQEETIPEESTISESNVGNDPSTLANFVEPGSKLDAKEVENPANSEIKLPLDRHVENPVSGNVEEGLPYAEEPPITRENLESISAKNVTSSNEGIHPCHDENVTEPAVSAENLATSEAGEDSLDITGNVDSNLCMLKTTEVSEKVANVSFEGPDGNEQGKLVCSGTEQEESKISELKTDEASVSVYTADSSVGLVGESDILKRHDSVEASDGGCVEEYADRVFDDECGLKSSEGNDQNVSSNTTIQMGKHEVEVLPTNSEAVGSFQVCPDESDIGGSVGSEPGSENAEQSAVSKKMMDASMPLNFKEKIDDTKDAETSASKGESTLELPSISGDNSKALLESYDDVDVSNVNKSSEMVVLSSTTESFAGDNRAESFVHCHNDSTKSEEKCGTQLPAGILNDSQHVSLSESKLDICETSNDKELPTDAENVNLKNVDMLLPADDRISPSSVMSEGIEEKVVVPSMEISSPAEQDGEPEIAMREPTVFGLSPSGDHPEEVAARISSEAEVVNTVEDEVAVTGGTAGLLPSETNVKSPETLAENDARNTESPSTETVNFLNSSHSEEKSSLKECVSTDLVSCGHQEETVMKVEREKQPKQTAEIEKASGGSLTIISSSEPSQTEKDDREDASGTEAGNQFVKTQPFSEVPKRKDVTGDDPTFTFKVDAMLEVTERESERTWSPLLNAEKCNPSVIVTEAKPSGEAKTARTPKQKTPRQNARTSDGEHVHGTSKGTSERKGRRASAKGTTKENAKNVNTEGANVDKVSGTLSTSSSERHVQSEKVQPYKHIEQSKAKPSGAAAVPDLNNSASTSNNSLSASYRQPFTDVQQVQLRAQIFVYGSLIQGTAPDEACMVSAFGSSEGRSIWEPVLRAAAERVRSQKSNSIAAETPLRPQTVTRASNAKQGLVPSKVPSSPVAQASSSKCTPTSVVNNPVMPLSSPFWSISTPSHDKFPLNSTHKGPVVDYQHPVSPLHSFQTPTLRNFIGHPSWPSQPRFPGPWLASPQSSAINTSVHFQPVTLTETVKLTPVRDSSGPLTSSMKHATSSPPVQSAAPTPVHVGASLLPDSKMTASGEGHSVDSKSRKRKKNQSSNSGQISLLSEARAEPAVDSHIPFVASKSITVPVSISSAPGSPVVDTVPNKVASPVAAVCPVDVPKKGNLDTGKVVTCSEESLSKVAEAKSQAEDAAALAAATVTHSEDIWRQLAKQKETGDISEVEAKLASAAAAISAAASVAKAAAAAAKVACNVALQAKLMADEAFNSDKTSGGLIPPTGTGTGTATPASILKGGSSSLIDQSGSILLAAKEAAKRRVEAATAASKQAENLDAIVKAAELAAAAVSQAGKIVAMGEPLPLSDLIQARSSDLTVRSRDFDKDQSGATCVDHSKVRAVVGADDGVADVIKHSVHAGGSDLQSGKDFKLSDTAQSCQMGSQPSDVAVVRNDHDGLVGAFPEDSIKESSAVEVYKCGDGQKSAWYSANVVTLEHGKAYVRYADLPSEEGSGNLCEWVQLKGEGDQAPVIRSAHPFTALQYQGTRKRRRAALGDYAWCIGDRVDVWIDDCWWEGVVTEKNEKDETTLKVNFPAHGETSTVRAWNLRTSRLWKDGKWVEWSSTKGHNVSEQSDTPQEKRQRRGSPTVPVKGKDRLANDAEAASGKAEEFKLLDLAANERKFDVGKTTKEENKRVARKPLRTGPSKEGPRVVFGVPKPTGKKRKFMEVSKQFPANNSEKKNETSESVKFAKYLMPQSRNDPKGKQKAESKPRVPTLRKSNRTLPQRDKVNSTSARNFNSKNSGKGTEDSVDHDEETTEKSAHDSSASGESVEAPLSSLIAQTLSSNAKKVSSFNSKIERLNRAKPTSSVGKLTKIEEEKTAEPRRSNRRTQPTHRLLEGLQSSMMIPKMPAVSHEKGQRNPSRNVFTRGK